jgi:Rrf2 family protein
MRLKHKHMIVIAVVTDIALGGRSRLINGRQLENRHELPARYLEPLLQALVHAGILSGVRGPGGGYKLAREPAQITVEDILRATGGLEDSEDFVRSPLLNSVVKPLEAPTREENLEDPGSWPSCQGLLLFSLAGAQALSFCQGGIFSASVRMR